MTNDNPLVPYLQVEHDETLSAAKALNDKLQMLGTLVEGMKKYVVPDVLPNVMEISEKIANFEVRVSLVGQVKAGKTALTNGLINKPEMLPSDVNPWTTVVTSVHINTPKPDDKRAVFTFFNQDEWTDMVNVGGRLGEAAQRTNFDAEFDEIKAQITEMQENAERRLGRNFKYLLGSQHNFTGFHPKLIKRYVCLGDEDDIDTTEEGRFADLTKSADIYFDEPHYHLPTIIRDTPGVNDPFLVRETVTINSLSDSDICVIVLSAHQTFTTVDIALVRILMAMKHDQIVLFINRIDELQDPDRQIDEIDASVRQTLAEQGLPETLPIVFGSALWANAASFGVTDGTLGNSESTLKSLIAAREEKFAALKNPPMGPPNGSAETTRYKIDDLSGLGELRHVIETQFVQSIGADFYKDVTNQALDLCQQSAILLHQTLDQATPIRDDLDVDDFIDQLDIMLSDVNSACRNATVKLSETMLLDITTAYHKFIDIEKATLEKVLKSGGASTDWTPQSDKLRFELNQIYKTFGTAGTNAIQTIYNETAQKVSDFYGNILTTDSQLFSVDPPVAPQVKTPASLMQSMTIDITSGWLGGWFAKKLNKSAYTKRLETIVTDEMLATVHDMRDIYVVDFVKNARLKLHDFLAAHIQTLQNLSLLDGEQQRSDMRRKLGVDAEVQTRLQAIKDIQQTLQSKRDAQISAG